jgi:hypothetical protein
MTWTQAVVAAAVLTWWSFALPAGAHEGAGQLTVEQAQPGAERQIRYVVRLTWLNDGHAGLDATVTATVLAPDGTPQTPAALQPADQDGRYETTVTFPNPGAWTVRFTSVSPRATLQQPAVIEPPTTTTTAATTTSTSEPVASEPPEEQPAGRADPPGGGSALPVVLGLAVLVVVAGVLAALRRRAA